MRNSWAINLAAATLGMMGCSDAVAADGANRLTIYVDLSEWTPSQKLELDLASGDYVVTPPAAGWPEGFPMKPSHAGRLKSDVIENVRQLSDRAFASGVNELDCTVKLRGRPPPPPGNAVGPAGFTLVMNGVARRSGELYCLTSDARVFYDVVSTLFDHRRP